MKAFINYDFLELRGRGAFSSVYRAREVKTGKIVAIKVCDFSSSSDRGKRQIINEIGILKSLNHPGIPGFISSFEDDNRIYMVFDYIDGPNLLEKVKAEGILNEDKARKYFSELVSILIYLLDNRVVHRDIKADNIIINTDSDHVHLIDFGLAVTADQLKTAKPVGTTYYVAPEVVRHLPCSEKIDVWSLGVCLYGVIVGKFPFYDEDPKRTLQIINFKKPKFPASMNSVLKDLLLKMLRKNMCHRITIGEIATHPWITEDFTQQTNS